MRKWALRGGEVVLSVGISHDYVCSYCATCILCKVRKGPAYRQDWVFVPPLPCDLADLNARIIAAVMNIDAPMLTRVCVART